MQRLTLEDAIGQTLLAKMEIGEDHLLLFSGGCVRLKTHYESYAIYDFAEGDDPLDRLEGFDDKTLDKLHAKGFISAIERSDTITRRKANRAAYEKSREESLRLQYEHLRVMFEPK